MKTELRPCRYCGSIPICKSEKYDALNLNIERWEITCPQCNITLRVAGEKKYSKEIKNKVIDKWNSDEKWTERKKFDNREFLF